MLSSSNINWKNFLAWVWVDSTWLNLLGSTHSYLVFRLKTKLPNPTSIQFLFDEKWKKMYKNLACSSNIHWSFLGTLIRVPTPYLMKYHVCTLIFPTQNKITWAKWKICLGFYFMHLCKRNHETTILSCQLVTSVNDYEYWHIWLKLFTFIHAVSDSVGKF